MTLRGLGLLVAVLGLRCATAQVTVPPDAMATSQRTLQGEERFLRVSMFVTPFFGDATKKFLSPSEPKFVELVVNPDGSPVLPGASERVLPAGTLVRIKKLEFPTAYVMAERVLYTPRTLIWLYLDVAGTPKGTAPHLIVLRPGLSTQEELMTEVDRLLTRDDPAKRIEAMSDVAREAITRKMAVVDIPAEALEMAWGPPEKKVLSADGARKKETWSWGNGKRTAVLLDGMVAELN